MKLRATSLIWLAIACLGIKPQPPEAAAFERESKSS
jgi:hypothetical protein